VNRVVVDIADAVVSNNADDLLVTYSLGSCIGVTIHDPVAGVGGMIHGMLPLSKVDREKAVTRPFMFVDTGVTRLLAKLFEMGLRKADATVRVAGCSRILDHKGLFKIGERNYTVFRKILWKNGMMIESEDIGGDASRTIKLDMQTGIVMLKSGGVEREL
jgi:chemotaxis protein CheD